MGWGSRERLMWSAWRCLRDAGLAATALFVKHAACRGRPAPIAWETGMHEGRQKRMRAPFLGEGEDAAVKSLVFAPPTRHRRWRYNSCAYAPVLRRSGCELDAGGAELVCGMLGQLTQLLSLDVR